MTLDMICRCKVFSANYTCVACKVKRGDYRTWMDAEPERLPRGKRECLDCKRTVFKGPRCYRCGQLNHHRLVRSA